VGGPPADMKHHLIIAGNIGVGKSTLVQRLCHHWGWQPFFEAVAENPYLSDFYGDMPRWGFHSQIFFLANRLHIHQQIAEHPTSVIQDRSVYEDAEVFARNLYEQGHLDHRDYATYRDLYESLVGFLPPPDLVVYLRASVDTLVARIGRRGRGYEVTIRPDYLEQLNALYDVWIEGFRQCPVLVLPADHLDFVAYNDDFELITEQIAMQLGLTADSFP
jgi:deoxyadenosine/deoxycytidine kinase